MQIMEGGVERVGTMEIESRRVVEQRLANEYIPEERCY